MPNWHKENFILNNVQIIKDKKLYNLKKKLNQILTDQQWQPFYFFQLYLLCNLTLDLLPDQFCRSSQSFLSGSTDKSDSSLKTSLVLLPQLPLGVQPVPLEIWWLSHVVATTSKFKNYAVNQVFVSEFVLVKGNSQVEINESSKKWKSLVGWTRDRDIASS